MVRASQIFLTLVKFLRSAERVCHLWQLPSGWARDRASLNMRPTVRLGGQVRERRYSRTKATMGIAFPKAFWPNAFYRIHYPIEL